MVSWVHSRPGYIIVVSYKRWLDRGRNADVPARVDNQREASACTRFFALPFRIPSSALYSLKRRWNIKHSLSRSKLGTLWSKQRLT